MSVADIIFIVTIAITALLAFYQGVRVGARAGAAFVLKKLASGQLEAFKTKPEP